MRLGPLDVPVPTLATALYAVVVLLVFVVAASTSGGAFDAHNLDWQGLSGARDTADAAGVDTTVLTEPTDYELLDADGTVALLVDPGETTSTQRAQLRAFVARGGTVVVATSDAETSEELLSALDVDLRVDGAPLRDDRVHGPSPAFPLVQSTAEHPYVAGAEGMALNHGSALGVAGAGPSSDAPNGTATAAHRALPADHEAWTRADLQLLAATSSFAYVDRDGDATLDDEEVVETHAVVAREAVGRGEVVAVSDPSVFINAMQEREANRAFLAGLLGEHERLVIDRTGQQVPPLVAAILTVRETPSLAAVLALVPLIGLLTWERRAASRLRAGVRRVGRRTRSAVPGPLRRLGARCWARVAPWAAARGLTVPGPGPRRDADAPDPDREALLAYLRANHPDLDERQRERVLGGIMGVDAESKSHDRGD